MSSKLLKPIGILGGTFDPIHNGHLHIASFVKDHTPIEKIYFLPCCQPVHRCQPEASVEDRVNMIKLAITGSPSFFLDDREVQRKEPSYMIDTLISLRHEYPHSPFCLILGSDAYSSIENWKKWQKLLDYTHFMVINRPEFNSKSHPNSWLQQHETSNLQDLTSHLAGKIFFLMAPPSPISATNIRRKIKQHEEITSLVPYEVAQYVKKHALYK